MNYLEFESAGSIQFRATLVLPACCRPTAAAAPPKCLRVGQNWARMGQIRGYIRRVMRLGFDLTHRRWGAPADAADKERHAQ